MRAYDVQGMLLKLYDTSGCEEWYYVIDVSDDEVRRVYFLERTASRISMLLDDGRVAWADQHWFKIKCRGTWSDVVRDVPVVR